MWPSSVDADCSCPEDQDTNAEDDEGDGEQLRKFFSLKCSKGSVAIFYLGLFCQFVSKALNFLAP